MTVNELAKELNAKVFVPVEAEISSYYAGDFLSRVMGRAPSRCAWFTVMANVNVAGVATLADIACVVLCEGVAPDERLTEKCREEGIALLGSDMGVYECCRAVK